MAIAASSDPVAAGTLAPKRERGRQRVQAIMSAAMEVFAEKGFDAATMTEIAVRSDTAVGSLYRFFSSKEALADALLLRYTQHAEQGLEEIKRQVPGLSVQSVAGLLVDFMVALQTQRRYALVLLDARGGSGDRRTQFRRAIRAGLAAILRKVSDTLTPARARAMAPVLLHLLKGVSLVRDEEPAVQASLTGEIRELVRLYLLSVR
ncbi:TetR/AcrR family transcriptional regulator [Bordetella sp. FB-8]|uniref:TetR/AcrR family transcriptional regulator n=1 Tax=Bordetella sp. FB-8 TaxID=1159870 RepID=UPI00036ADC98|nr:TetR/AcrR family transcriptional regulator [Bordetella sp. FB-8]